MKRTIATTSTALVLSLAALTGADAAALNTVPLNAFGKPVSSTPVAYGGINTTINSSIKPYVPPTIKPVTLNTVPLNTQGKPVSTTPVAYGGVNTTIGSSLNVPKTVVTTAAGLLQNTGNFATPNVKATIATGPIPTPKPGSTTPIYGSDSAGPTVGDSLASLTDLAQTNDSVSSINTTQSINPARLISANDQTFTNPSFAKGLTNLDFNALSAANNPKPLNSQTAGSLTLGSARPSSEIVAKGGATNLDGGTLAAAGAALGTVSNAPPAHNLDLDDQLSTAFSATAQAVKDQGVIIGVPGVNGTPYAIPNSTSNGGQPAIGSQAGINLANAFNGGAGSGGATTGSSGGGAGAANGANTGGAQSAGPLATNGTFGDFLGSSSQQSNVPSGAFQTNANNASTKQAQLMVTAANNGDTQFTTVPPAPVLAISGTTLSAGTTNPIIKAYNNLNTNLYEFNNSSAGKSAVPILGGLIIGLGTDGFGTVIGAVADGVPVAEAGAPIVEAVGEGTGAGGLNLGLGGGGAGGGTGGAVTTVQTTAENATAWANLKLGQLWHVVQGTLPQ